MAEVFNIFSQVAEEEDVAVADLASDFNLFRQLRSTRDPGKLTLAPSQVPMIRPPLRTNFMLLVPEAL